MLFISSRLHGIFDYLLALTMVVSPWVFGMSDTLGQAMTIVGAGCFILILALVTDYELSAVRVVSLSWHIVLDVAVGLVLIASPWMFSFDNLPHGLHIFAGLALVVVAAFTVRLPKNVRGTTTQYVQWV